MKTANDLAVEIYNGTSGEHPELTVRDIELKILQYLEQYSLRKTEPSPGSYVLSGVCPICGYATYFVNGRFQCSNGCNVVDAIDISPTINDSECMHDNCPDCKNGTCSGVHMISCPCPKCSPRCTTI